MSLRHRRGHLGSTLGLLAPLVLASAVQAGASAGLPPAREIRGIWITRWDYRTELDVRRAVRWSAAIGANRVFFQVRGRADAFYRSPYEPWGEEIGGRDPGFDPLSVALDEARKAGVGLHAWINLMPGWKGERLPAAPTHILHRRPDWFLEDSKGTRHLTHPSDYTILNPCLPEVRTYLVAIVADIVTRYPVNGIQLDYARYVARDPKRYGEVPWDPKSLSLFRQHSGTAPRLAPTVWDAWRRRSLDVLLSRIATAVRERRPGCEISVAALPNYQRAREVFFQDVLSWQRQGFVDAVYPMTYAEDGASFSLQVARILKESPLGAVVPGIGVHLHDDPEQTVRQIGIARALGARGYCLFAYASLFPSPSHEYRPDERSRRLRSELRRVILAANSPPRSPRPEPRAPAATRSADGEGLQLSSRVRQGATR